MHSHPESRVAGPSCGAKARRVLIAALLAVLGVAAAGAQPLFFAWDDAGFDPVAPRRGPGSACGAGGKMAVVDSAGATYAAVAITDGTSSNFVFFKTNPGGTLAWARYFAHSFASESPDLVLLDSAGNPILVWSDSTSVLARKYSPAGAELWTWQSDPSIWYSGSVQATLDGSDNLFVATMDANTSDGASDYRVVKVDSSGSTVATGAASPGADTDAQPCAIALDGEGHVWVTGISVSYTPTFDLDWFTARFTPALAVAGTAALDVAPSGMNDWAVDLAADAAGNAYVAGGVGLVTDARLVKYDGTVTEVWTANYDSGGADRYFALAYDGADGLYVAGLAGAAQADCRVAKYSTAGVAQWETLWAGAAGGADSCWDIALGPAGRVYAVGVTSEAGENNLLALGLGPTGAVDWWHSSDPAGSDSNRGAVVDPATGDLIALGYTGQRSIQPSNFEGFRLGRFQSDGTPVWEVTDPVTTWGGVDLVGAAQDRLGRRALATDAGGNLLVTGQVSNGTTADLFVAKLDRAGRTLWAQRLDTGGNESGRAVAVDAAGNVYVLGFGSIGRAPGSENSGRLIVAKYDPQGGEVWRHISTAFDRPRGLAVDGLGNVYAVARARILRFDSEGALVYSVSTSAVGPVNDFVLDAAGSLYLVGGSANLRASKYDALGVQQWFREVDLGGTEVAWAAVLDPTGNLAAVGEGPGAGGRDMLVSRFDPLGNPLENLLYTGCGGDDAGYAVVPGDAGSLILGGDAVVGGVRYLCLLKVTPGTPGHLAQVLYGVATEERRLLALAYDPAGRLFALGRRTACGNEDWSTTVWNASLGFVQELVEDVSPEDRPVGLAVGAAGDLFVGGSVFDPIAREQAKVVKYGLPGLVATPASGLLTSETGATAAFDVTLNVPPASGVTVPVATSDASEGLLSETSLVFTPGDWNQPQSVTATGQDDALADGSLVWVANLGPATSADGAYAGQSAVAALVNLDDETDGDGDGVVDAAEGPELPNRGDANGDGVPDYLQGNVTTAYRTPAEPVTVAASAGCTLADVEILEEAAFPPDPDGTYPQGIVSFRAACTNATVSVLFHANTALPPGYRKYGPIEPGNPATAQWFDYPAVVGRRGVGAQEVGQLRLRFLDGLLGDQSGPDGEIFDPGGPVAGPRILRDGFESGGLRTWAAGRGVI